MESVANFRLRADRLRTYLGSQGVKVTKAVALEAQAAQVAVRDWNTLSALAPKIGKKSKPDNASVHPAASTMNAYGHLFQCIGGKLPANLNAGFLAEIREVRQAVEIGGLPQAWLLETKESDLEMLRCPHCVWRGFMKFSKAQDGGGTEFVCRGCLATIDIAVDLLIPKMLESKESYLLIRQALSIKASPILGYESYDNTAAAKTPNGPLVSCCRGLANKFSYAIDLACFDFGINLDARRTANFGYYIGSEEVAEKLQHSGVSRAQAQQVGWLDAHQFPTMNREIPLGLVVVFLPDPKGGPISFWGYCPRSMRASRTEKPPLAYFVGRNYSKDAVFLGHLIDARPLVLVDGFMQAIALRQAGVNAVAVPSIQDMGEAALRQVMANRSFIVVSGHAFLSIAYHALSSVAFGLGVECRYMDVLSDYEGPEGFSTDRFVSDFIQKASASTPAKGKRSLKDISQ